MVRSPEPEQRWFVARVLHGLMTLLKGMGITFRYVSHPSTVVTQQYPENRATLRLPERSRTVLSLIYEDNGLHRCTACRVCETACPNASIVIVSRKGPVTGKNEIDHFVWRMDTCTFCSACVDVCPFSALTLDGSFENAVYDRRLLVYSLNRYAGPPASVLLKIEDPEQRHAMMAPRTPLSGPIPLGGTAVDGLPEPLPGPSFPAPDTPSAEAESG